MLIYSYCIIGREESAIYNGGIMLDDMNVIAQRDTADMLGAAAELPDQLLRRFVVDVPNQKHEIKNVVFSALGGSALPAEFVRTWPRLSIPFVLSKDYTIPHFVDESTLFVVASHSGSTEESIAAYAEARKKKATVVVMSSGGPLREMTIENNDVFIELPSVKHPRLGYFYAYRALIDVLVAYKLIQPDLVEVLEATVTPLNTLVQTIQSEVTTGNNSAKQLALQLVGKTPIIYAGQKTSPAAFKWKISINESAKNTAWTGTVPDMNHNEFTGWTSHPIEKPFAVVDLLSSFEQERVQKRFEITDRLLSGMRPKAMSVQAVGESELEHMLFLVIFGEFVSLYLALLNGVDPSPVTQVEKLKAELG